MRPRDAQDTAPGQAAYNALTLRAYDAAVLGATNRLIWRCPTPRLLEFFRTHASTNHLDVGVGSGYFLANAGFGASTRLALMDLNERALQYAKRRVAHLDPAIYRVDVLRPFVLDVPAFDSISLFYLLHCLPGTMADKAIAFEHLGALLRPAGTLFGATVVNDPARSNPGASALTSLYNRLGVFSNEADDEASLRRELEKRFRAVRIERVGCVALFQAECG